MFIPWSANSVHKKGSADLRCRWYRPLVETLEERCLLAVTITEFSVPSPPSYITSSPDGNLWYTSFFPGPPASSAIGRITPSGMVTEFPLPATDSPRQITAGGDGNLWFLYSSGIGRITTTGVITEFPISTPEGTIEGIAAGPDGNAWFTLQPVGNQFQIGRITPAGVVTTFTNPFYAVPIFIAAGPDGNLWFSFSLTPLMQRITPTGNFLPQFSLGGTGASINQLFAFDAAGNLWAPMTGRPLSGPQIARRTPDGVVTFFSGFSRNTFSLSNVTLGPDGNMWVVDLAAVAQITPAGVVREFPAPTGTLPSGSTITTGPDGNLWYTEPSSSKIVRVHIEMEAGTPIQRFVDQVYQDLLHRPADPGGLAFFSNLIDQGLVSRSQVVLAIEESPEYRTDVVVDVYGQFLKRSPDPSGLNGWVDFLGQGGTRRELEALIMSSSEYQIQRGGQTNVGFLQAVYEDVLRRIPDPSGLIFWSDILADGESGDQPATSAKRREVAASILMTPEATQDEVRSLYNTFLRRQPDPTGLAALSLALQRGLTDEQAIAILVGSDEYFENA